MKKTGLVIVVLLSIILTSCWYNHKWDDMHPNGQLAGPTPTCDTVTAVSYSVSVKPVLMAKCATAGCHDGTNLDYSVFTNVVLDAHKGHGNDIVTRINLPVSSSTHMPQGGVFLPACDLAHIRLWIAQGCQNN